MVDRRLLLLSFILLSVTTCSAFLPVITHVHSKFEYQYSFKGPYLTNSKGDVPFWNYGGSCIPSDDQVRVCPSIKSRRGWIWSKNSFSSKHWMVDVSIRVTGRLKTGADGMAIWFTSSPGSEGMALGNGEIWQGLGIMLDSFDNNGLHDNPKILGVTNDGTMRFDHGIDGAGQEVGSCLKDFRNKPNPVKLRIMYLRGSLEVWVHEGMSSVVDDHQLCFKADNVQNIPLEGYFGVTAATGGLSDDHDVISFITHRLEPMEERAQEVLKELNQAEMEKVTDKYSTMAEEFDQQREEYRKKHDDSGDWQYEIEMEQNVRHIADMQGQLSRQISQLMVAVESGSAGGSSQPSSSGTSAAIQKTETAILQQLAQLRALVEGKSGGGVASEQLQPLYEIKQLVQQNSQQLAELQQKIKASGSHQCPPVTSDPSSCVSPTLFLVVMVMVLVVVIGYQIYRQRQEAVAKKFF